MKGEDLDEEANDSILFQADDESPQSQEEESLRVQAPQESPATELNGASTGEEKLANAASTDLHPQRQPL